MLDLNALNAEIVRKGYNNATFARAIGLNPATFCVKKKKGTFYINEVEKIVQILEIDPVPIFFSNPVTNKVTHATK